MSVTLKELVDLFGGKLVGKDTTIDCVASIANAQVGSISFISDSKYRKSLASTQASAMILSEDDQCHTQLPCIVTDNPYAYFAKVSSLLNPNTRIPVGVHSSVVMGEVTNIAKTCAIAPNVVIGNNVTLSDGVEVGSGCFIGDNVKIGKNTKLQPNVTIYANCVIGASCTIAAGAVIGADGFGYANQDGIWVKIPQVGRVVIADHVDIGANTTIDRGALDDTIIEQGVKLDNLIQIGHNCVIGEHSVIAGCVGIAGSAKIGKRCKIGGAAMVLGHLEIADDVTISPGSMITRSLQKSDTYTALMPFQKHEDWLKTAASLRHLTEVTEKIKVLENTLAQLKLKNQ
ncbi:UDP-3-O-(3-hydroxymyristoyl)glucosamine N-acyltransferase [Candidatus Methylopumilus turicensis]|uniref:UDP-3-O-acylglucosamine N-acyltransferase n=1 Tax=Candidatus Methylopumilus turicensis TaxID=1581680 RepID=A0A0B7IZQ0_9PROT|nr:UDP-3-O-(3-hydroxymyristoyl)glucosamine N-acyltransferase [Candidatus Methylopumilus turicensis]CEN55902.1 UDP-3-O-(3-hydroxymyristoyl)-glucosamine N-acyltransferase [Candidatus Methylopumilus turicensis]